MVYSSGRVVLAVFAAGAVFALELCPVSHAATCTLSGLSQPFSSWLDNARYELAPGGDFESGNDGWTLSDGASIVPGSEPYASTGELGSSSLSLPQGSVATSPPVCVAATYPSARFFIVGSGTVSVYVVYDGLPIPAGAALGGEYWEPSPVMLTSGAVWGVLSGGSALVLLRFVASLGDVGVDDVWVDPWSRGG